MKYKYSRKEIAKLIKTKFFFGYYEKKAIRYLLALAEKPKEEKYEIPGLKETVEQLDNLVKSIRLKECNYRPFQYPYGTPSQLSGKGSSKSGVAPTTPDVCPLDETDTRWTGCSTPLKTKPEIEKIKHTKFVTHDIGEAVDSLATLVEKAGDKINEIIDYLNK